MLAPHQRFELFSGAIAEPQAIASLVISPLKLHRHPAGGDHEAYRRVQFGLELPRSLLTPAPIRFSIDLVRTMPRMWVTFGL